MQLSFMEKVKNIIKKFNTQKRVAHTNYIAADNDTELLALIIYVIVGFLMIYYAFLFMVRFFI